VENIEFWQEIFYSEISTLFDPEARFKPEHKRNVRMIQNALQKPLGRIHKLSKPILRNSFLYGCREFTRNESIEHLIVGFGRRRDGGTDIFSVLHITGNETSVPVPQALINLIITHAIRDSRNETILFHNHPVNWLNAILPFLPAASLTRRKMIKEKYFQPFFLLKNIFASGELVGTIRRNVSINWTLRESFQAQMRVAVKRILRRYGYPPDKQAKATETVLEQASLICRDWAETKAPA